jgi:hypothetical protein
VAAGSLGAGGRAVVAAAAVAVALVVILVGLPAGMPFELLFTTLAWASWVPNLLAAEWVVRATGFPAQENAGRRAA